MRFHILIVILFFLASSSYSQDKIKPGDKYFEEGDYQKADSAFRSKMRNRINSYDEVFNLAITRFYLGDTCNFCNLLHAINSDYETDEEALDLYYQFCGKADTVYYDKNDKTATRDDYKYYEVITQDKYENQITGKFHKKKKDIEITSCDLLSIKTEWTDIFAIYTIENGEKFFTLTDCPPSFPNGIFHSEYLSGTEYFKQIQKILNLTGVRVEITYDVDIKGKAINPKIVSTRPEVPDNKNLVNAINGLILQLPEINPAKFRNKPVKFKIREFLIL